MAGSVGWQAGWGGGQNVVALILGQTKDVGPT